MFPSELIIVNERLIKLDNILLHAIFERFRVFVFETEQKIRFQDIVKKVAPASQRWFVESLALLSENGFIKQEGEWLVTSDVPSIDLDVALKQFMDAYGNDNYQDTLVSRVTIAKAVLDNMEGILTGAMQATDVLFPKGTLDLVEGVYASNIVSDFFNGELASLIRRIIELDTEELENKRVRIIEFGAGTGGTTSVVLNALKDIADKIEVYCFTDLSRAFLNKAAEKYGTDFPFVEYRIANVEHSLYKQEFEEGYFDIAFATNVLHATKDIGATVAQVKSVLKKNGVLLLNELSSRTPFYHLVFGTLPGWWLYNERSLRIKGSPLLSPRSWSNVLAAQGYVNISIPFEDNNEFGQQLILAESDGVIVRDQSESTNILPEAKVISPEAKAISPPTSDMALPASGNSQEFLDGEIQKTIKAILAVTVKFDVKTIQLDEPFSHYGIDSILGAAFVNAINLALHTDLNTTCLYNYTTVQALGTYLLENYDSALRTKLIGNQPPNESLQNTFEVATQTPAAAQQMAQSRQGKIAVIGLSGRFAEAETTQAYWGIIQNAASAVSDVDRWGMRDYFNAEVPFCSSGGYINDTAGFDPEFFKISGEEACYMDPQQRVFLEQAWLALEDAGYSADKSSLSRCHVYVGAEAGDYAALLDETAPPQAMWGNAGSILSSRIAYLLDIHGPAVTIDTACSSSLVALCLACQALESHDADMALCGGVAVDSTAALYTKANKAMMLSPSGRCHTFDARADGFVPAEGAGAVVLKRLEDAQDAGDQIIGVIRGYGTNQDGTTNGITAPSGISQHKLVRDIYTKFAVNAADIGYFEAHGTGTPLGDPIEFEAIAKAYSEDSLAKQYCAIGSVKSNIGHARAASGVAGLIKLLLCLKHQVIPGTHNFESQNQNIDLANSPFFVNKNTRFWESRPGKKRCGALSSFGMSGTNAHVVLEEYVSISRYFEQSPSYLVAITARTHDLLVKQVELLLQHVTDIAPRDLANLCYTLLLKRKHHDVRAAWVVNDKTQLLAELRSWLKSAASLNNRVAVEPFENSALTLATDDLKSLTVSLNNGKLSSREYTSKLETLRDAFVAGTVHNLSGLFAEGNYLTLAAPLTIFNRRHCWARNAIAPPITTTETPANKKLKNIQGDSRIQNLDENCYLLQPVWKTAVDVPSFETQANPDPQPCLIVSNSVSLIERVQKYRSNGVPLLIDPEKSRDELTMNLGAISGFREILLLVDDNNFNNTSNDKLVLAVFRFIKALFDAGKNKDNLEISLFTQRGCDPFNGSLKPVQSALHGLMGTVIKECLNWQARIIDVDDFLQLDMVVPLVSNIPLSHQIRPLCYRNGRWYERKLTRLPLSSGINTVAQPTYKKGGTYLVIGGASGVGNTWSNWMVEHYGANIVWIGRRPQDENIQQKIAECCWNGIQPTYISADITSKESVLAAYDEVKAKFGKIDGVVNSAVVMEAKAIATMEEDCFSRIYSVKEMSSKNIVDVFRNEALDFFVTFSSMVSVIQNINQIHYAAGCCYQDAFMRNIVKKMDVFSPHTKIRVINWGFWDQEENKNWSFYRRLSEVGVKLISAQDGFLALQTLLDGDYEQLAFIKTENIEHLDMYQASSQPLDSVSTGVFDMSRYINALAEEV